MLNVPRNVRVFVASAPFDMQGSFDAMGGRVRLPVLVDGLVVVAEQQRPVIDRLQPEVVDRVGAAQQDIERGLRISLVQPEHPPVHRRADRQLFLTIHRGARRLRLLVGDEPEGHRASALVPARLEDPVGPLGPFHRASPPLHRSFHPFLHRDAGALLPGSSGVRTVRTRGLESTRELSAFKVSGWSDSN